MGSLGLWWQHRASIPALIGWGSWGRGEDYKNVSLCSCGCPRASDPPLQCATIIGIFYHLHLFKDITRKPPSIFDSETLFDLYQEQLNHCFYWNYWHSLSKWQTGLLLSSENGWQSIACRPNLPLSTPQPCLFIHILPLAALRLHDWIFKTKMVLYTKHKRLTAWVLIERLLPGNDGVVHKA